MAVIVLNDSRCSGQLLLCILTSQFWTTPPLHSYIWLLDEKRENGDKIGTAARNKYMPFHWLIVDTNKLQCLSILKTLYFWARTLHSSFHFMCWRSRHCVLQHHLLRMEKSPNALETYSPPLSHIKSFNVYGSACTEFFNVNDFGTNTTSFCLTSSFLQQGQTRQAILHSQRHKYLTWLAIISQLPPDELGQIADRNQIRMEKLYDNFGAQHRANPWSRHMSGLRSMYHLYNGKAVWCCAKCQEVRLYMDALPWSRNDRFMFCRRKSDMKIEIENENQRLLGRTFFNC
jgi:hypothetical protein